MLFEGYVNSLWGWQADIEQIKTGDKEAFPPLKSMPTSPRIIVGVNTIIVCGNSPGHVLSLLERYEKASEIQVDRRVE